MKTRALLALGSASLVLAGFFFLRHRPHEAGPGSLVEGLDDEGRHVTLRVDWVEPDKRDAEGETHLYGLSLKVGEAWEPYCAPDRDGRRAAIPLSGAFDARSARVAVDAGADVLTFACTSGAIGKCVRLGYKPWKTEGGVATLADLHAACVRMIRADYCGDGRTHTVDGTSIDIFDRRGLQKPDPDPARPEELEAGWSPSGATYLNVPRWSDDVAAIVAECPERLAHRTSLDGSLDATQVAARFPETLLFDNRMHDPRDRLAR